MTEIYLDHAATTPMKREVLEAMFPYFQQVYANPSSVHSAGQAAAAALATAREQIALVLGCRPDEVIFMSGGTEADNLAVIGVAESQRHAGNHVVISAIEHEAVFQTATELEQRGFRISFAPVDHFGVVDPATIASLVTPQTVLVSCMYANNEVGSIQPIGAIGAAVKSANPRALFHTDAVQAAGTLPIDVATLNVDLLSLSAHKMYGPRGIGVLYVRNGIEPRPLSHGGGQEHGRRSGTENVAGAVGMATALTLSDAERPQETARLTALRDHLISGILGTCPTAHLTGHPTNRLANHASFYFDDRTGESVLVDLDAAGIMCSTGSACHAGMTDPSRVLLAIGLPETLARNGIRMTLGRGTDQGAIDTVIAAMGEVFARTTASVAV